MTQSELEKVEALKTVVDDLEGFEKDFVRSMIRRPDTYNLTDKQIDILEQLHQKHCVGEDD